MNANEKIAVVQQIAAWIDQAPHGCALIACSGTQLAELTAQKRGLQFMQEVNDVLALTDVCRELGGVWTLADYEGGGIWVLFRIDAAHSVLARFTPATRAFQRVRGAFLTADDAQVQATKDR